MRACTCVPVDEIVSADDAFTAWRSCPVHGRAVARPPIPRHAVRVAVERHVEARRRARHAVMAIWLACLAPLPLLAAAAMGRPGAGGALLGAGFLAALAIRHAITAGRND